MMKTIAKLIQIVVIGLFLPVVAWAGFSGGGGGGGSYTLPVATTSTLGGIISDGSTVLVNASGVISTPVLPISGTFATNTLAYSPNGTNISPLALGTNLSITSGVINAAGGGGSTATLNLSDTTQSVSTATPSPEINVATRTITFTGTSGTVAIGAINQLGAPTINATSATTFTDLASLLLYAPAAGTNVTISNRHTFYIIDSTTAANDPSQGAFTICATPGVSAGCVSLGGGVLYTGNDIHAGRNVFVGPSGSLITGSAVSRLYDSTAPTITGFGTGAARTGDSGSAAFQINVGTGGTANTGSIVFANAANHFYLCTVRDETTTSGFDVAKVNSTNPTTQVDITHYTYAAPTTPAAWAASDHLNVQCSGT